MRHFEEGHLRAYYDGALSEEEHLQVQEHLAACSRCARQAAAIETRGKRITALLAGMDPRSAREPVSAQVARHHFDSYVELRKESSMLQKMFARRYRPVWGATAVALVLAIAFSFAPVRTFAGNLLALFRVQKVEFIEVSPSQIPDEETLQAALGRLEIVMDDQVTIEGGGEPQVIDEDTARGLSVFPVRFPTALSVAPHVSLLPETRVGMHVDLARVRALLAELGYGDTELPDSLDGEDIQVNFGPAVIAGYGDCQVAPAAAPASGAPAPVQSEMDCTLFIQMRSPVISAPAALDVDQLGGVYLQLLGLSAEEAERFSERVDWTTTFVVPVPGYANLEYEDVTVDGVPGTLIRSSHPSRDDEQYLLTWLKGGVAYALQGPGTAEDALEIAASLQ